MLDRIVAELTMMVQRHGKGRLKSELSDKNEAFYYSLREMDMPFLLETVLIMYRRLMVGFMSVSWSY